MSYKDYLEITAAWAAILTFLVAGYAYARHLLERREKRVRLEKHLKAEKELGTDKGQRTLAHLVARVGMSETDIMDAAFKSAYIDRRLDVDKAGTAVAIFLEYRS
jgi:H+/gluconate symporter-like permease